ncbi:MAG: YchJ family metal-binding protein [Cyanobacteria bacterium P01_A01_bin.116]
MADRCMCGSQRLFAECCGPYLSRERLAPTAEALMRSRYSAFCTGNIDYLMATRFNRTNEADDRMGLRQSIDSTEWTNLIVVSTKQGTAKDSKGIVEFVAAYRPKTHLAQNLLTLQPAGPPSSGTLPNQASPMAQLHERSRFIKKGDQWLYTDGDILTAYQPKRSHPCWCGSGKKFKQCHG